MTAAAFQALLYDENIIVIYLFSQSGTSVPKIGQTRLIYEQIESLKSTGHTVNLLSLEEIGSLMSFLLKLQGRIRRKRSMQKGRGSTPAGKTHYRKSAS